jgi:hypothetical protein
MPKWLQMRSPAQSAKFFEVRPDSPGYDEDPTDSHMRRDSNGAVERGGSGKQSVSPKMLYWVIGALVGTIWALAFVILSGRGRDWDLRMWGRKWSTDIVPKGELDTTRFFAFGEDASNEWCANCVCI